MHPLEFSSEFIGRGVGRGLVPAPLLDLLEVAIARRMRKAVSVDFYEPELGPFSGLSEF